MTLKIKRCVPGRRRYGAVVSRASVALSLSLWTAAAAGQVTLERGAQIRPSTRTAPATGLSPLHRVFGTIVTVDGRRLRLQLRNGSILWVDASQAYLVGHVSDPLYRGKPTVVVGTLGAGNTLFASMVGKAGMQISSWGVDR